MSEVHHMSSEYPGKRIVIEGTDGTGKTTAADLIAYRLRKNGLNVIRVDEPDSAIDGDGNVLVPAARELRKIIKDGTIERSPEANVNLFTASRFANWKLASLPGLIQGDFVIQARDFSSSEAYQGYAEGFGIDNVDAYTEKVLGPQYMHPDFQVILDFSDDEEDELERQKRISNRGVLEKPDTFEMRNDAFQQRIREGYRIIAERRGIELISANQTRDEIADTIWHKMVGTLGLQLTSYEWPKE